MNAIYIKKNVLFAIYFAQYRSFHQIIEIEGNNFAKLNTFTKIILRDLWLFRGSLTKKKHHGTVDSILVNLVIIS